MNETQLDQLLDQKIHRAKSGKLLRFAVLALLCLGALALIFHPWTRLRGQELPPEGQAAPLETEEPAPSESPALPTSSAVTPEPVESVPSSDDPNSVTHSIVLNWPEKQEPDGAIALRVMHGETELRRLKLDARNHWSAYWDDRYPAEELTLIAELPSGYAAETSFDGEDFSVVLVKTEEEPEASPVPAEAQKVSMPTGYYVTHLPQTGPVFWPIPLLLLAGLGCLTISCKRARR